MGYAAQSQALSPLGPVQLSGGHAEGSDPHAVARAGLGGSGGPLPHLDRIQGAFGRHDVSGVRVHSDAPARAAADQLGAKAYAADGAIASAGSLDLHTAAHEAAHVVQQRGGVSLKGNVSSAGDAYEQHADAVADAVVAGRSAEALLDAAPSGGASSGGAVQLKPKSGVTNALALAYAKDIPLGEKEFNYLKVEGAIGVGIKGEWTPAGGGDDAKVGHAVEGGDGDGVKLVEVAKEISVKEGYSLAGFKLETVTPAFSVSFPSLTDKIGDSTIDDALDGPKTEDTSVAKVGGEVEFGFSNGFNLKAALTVFELKKTPEGEWDFDIAAIELSGGKKWQFGPYATKSPKGEASGEFSVSPKVTATPNRKKIAAWVAEQAAKRTANAASAGTAGGGAAAEGAAAAGAGANATTAAELTVAVEGIGALEVGAIAAPIVFAAVSAWAISDLTDAIDRKNNLGTLFNARMQTFKTGFRAGLLGAEGKGRPHQEGAKRRQAGLEAYKKHPTVAKWMAALKSEGKDQGTIDGMVQAKYDAAVKKAANAIVQKATASFDSGLRRVMLEKYLDDHGDEWLAKPGLCFNVFKQLYPEGAQKPWTVPQATYERVRKTMKGTLYMKPWTKKPAGRKPKPKKANKDGTKTISGLNMEMINWCRAYIRRTGKFMEGAVVMAYEEAHPGHVLDESAKKSIANLCDEEMRNPTLEGTDRKTTEEEEDDDYKPTPRELKIGRESLWNIRAKAEKLRNKVGRSEPGESMWKQGEAERAKFVGTNDIKYCDQAMVSYGTAIEKWGGKN